MNGAFKLSTKFFNQNYTFHVYIIISARLYAILPNRRKKSDSRLFDALETIAQDRKPDHVLFHFKRIPSNALKNNIHFEC